MAATAEASRWWSPGLRLPARAPWPSGSGASPQAEWPPDRRGDIDAAAEKAGTSVAVLLGSTEAKKAFFRARTQLRNAKAARFTGFDAVEVAAAAGLDASDLYGNAVLPAAPKDG